MCSCCKGRREIDADECADCGGTGYENTGIPMFGLSWSSGYLWLLAQLPSARVRDPLPSDKWSRPAMEVLFDGGQGLLMPWLD